MSSSEYASQTIKMQRREHFRHLVQIAMADGKIDDAEMAMLQRIGLSLEFSVLETDELIDTTSGTIYNPPVDLSLKFSQVYSMVRLILADGIVELSEMHLAYNFAEAAGFLEQEIDKLLMFLVTGIKAGLSEDDLLCQYEKQ